MKEIEIWKDVVGFEGAYQVSSFGRVKNVRTNFILKPIIREKYTYCAVMLVANKIRKRQYIHALVLEAFVGLRPSGYECLHYDGNHSNNYVLNLRWGTHRENVEDAMRHGTFNHMVGSDHIMAKLAEADVIEIKRQIKLGIFQRDIAKQFGVKQQQISKINTGKRWGHLTTTDKEPILE